MAVGTRSYWVAVVSVSLMIVGAVSPWASTLGLRVDGSQDEVVLMLAVVAGLMLLLLTVLERWWLGLIPPLAGLVAAVLTGNVIRDISDLVPSASDDHAGLEWGIYLALLGSAGLVLSSVALFVETARTRAGIVRSRRGQSAWKLGYARSARARVSAPDERVGGEAAEPPSRKEFVQLARDYTPYIVGERDRLRLIVPTDDVRLSRLFWRGTTKEEPVLARALAALDRAGVGIEGMTFLDVGANIGQATFAALRAGFGFVVAFEPVVESFQLLRANLALNGVEDRVRTLQVALSDRSGSATIVLTPEKLGSARLPMGTEKETQKTRQTVTLVRLDDLVSDGMLDPAAIGLLWIDAEGHEAHVLRGAEQTLAPGFPVVAELNPGLAGADGLEALAAILRDRFTSFLDLRTKGATVIAAADLDGLIETTLSRGRVTDVLAFTGAGRGLRA